MMKRMSPIWSVVGMMLGMAVPPVLGGFALTDADRVVFYGDFGAPPSNVGTFIEQFVLIRYPQLRTRFWQVGPLGRATAENGLSEFDKSVADLKPTWLVLSFGGYDTAGKPYDATHYEAFLTAMTGLIDKAQGLGAKVMVLTPPRPEIHQKQLLQGIKYDEVVRKYSDGLAGLAQTKGVTLLDWNAAMTQYVEERADRDPPVRLTKDGVTVTEEGMAIAVDKLLTVWQAEPLEVRIHADWNSGQVQAEGCKSRWIKLNEETRLLELTGVPMPWGLSGRKNAFAENTAARRFCRILLTLENAPGEKLALGTTTTAAWLVSREQLQQGYDLTLGSPLFDAEAAKTLLDRLTKKNEAYRNLQSFDRRTAHEPVPEPELEPAYESHRKAWQLAVEGWNQVLARTPRTLDITLELSGANPSSQEKQPSPPKPK